MFGCATPARPCDTSACECVCNDLVCFLGVDAYKLMLVNLKNANLFHYVADAATSMEMVYPGTNMKLIAVGGLNGTNKIVAGSLSNFLDSRGYI